MKPLSLKMRAISLLSQREHSRVELRRKLQNILRKAAPAAEGEPSLVMDAQAELDLLLDWLQAQGYLSDQRFVESRVHARASRYGSLRIKQELAQHGLSLSAEAMSELKAAELERAKSIYLRKFGAYAPPDAAAKAKQMRFMTARGFSPETIRKLLRWDDD
ncbi:recombination regulator RecX [Paucibacter sp. TC2R-5]|uniref:recombination regulator RecX n=1 Tax=Paucibacter sp. TC2R-5 TaxID=2893555 RepID=UPI0021E4B712|nr:recombination regulator RecX [Paucibacter sp. TC2R-5]MCV2361596.1 recombination regulator RecX [Paucibacter sp. TC2R-5]